MIKWCILIIVVLFLASVLGFIVIIYTFRSTTEDLGFDIKVGLARTFSLVGLICLVFSLMVYFFELFL